MLAGSLEMEVEGGWDKRVKREENDKEENTEGRKPCVQHTRQSSSCLNWSFDSLLPSPSFFSSPKGSSFHPHSFTPSMSELIRKCLTHMSSVTGWSGEGGEGVEGQKSKKARELHGRMSLWLSIVPTIWQWYVLLTIVCVHIHNMCWCKSKAAVLKISINDLPLHPILTLPHCADSPLSPFP